MKIFLLLIFSFTLALKGFAQITYSGGVYTQDFNSLADDALYANSTTLPTGWVVSHGSYVWTNGSSGFSNNYGTFCFSSALGAADKSLGLVIGTTGAAYFGAQIRNTTGTTITSFTLSYLAEQWRVGATTANDQVTPFQFSLAATSLTNGTYTSFSSLDLHSIHDGDGTASALDGDSAVNQLLISSNISGLSWAPNQDLWIRWQGTSYSFNASHAMSVDNISFSTTPAPEPSVSWLAAGAFLVFRMTRRR